MGVNGLTQFLRPIYVKRRVKDLRNSTFGVDAMAWLYRGFYGQKYANNDINERFLSFYYRMLAQLRKYNIKVSVYDSNGTFGWIFFWRWRSGVDLQMVNLTFYKAVMIEYIWTPKKWTC